MGNIALKSEMILVIGRTVNEELKLKYSPNCPLFFQISNPIQSR